MIRKEGQLFRRGKANETDAKRWRDHAQTTTKTPTLRVAIFDLSFVGKPAIMETNRSMSRVYARHCGPPLKKCLLGRDPPKEIFIEA